MKNKAVNSISLQSIKETNYKSILYTIEENVKVSRTEISRITSLSPSTITNACNYLLSKGLIVQISRGFSLSGRKPIYLEINPKAGEIIGIIICKNNIKIVISNLKCEILYSSVYQRDKVDDNTVAELIETVLEEYEPHNVICIGVALDWEYDFNKRHIRPVYEIDAVKLKKNLNSKFNLPVTVEKYLDLCAVAESYFYYANNYSNLLYLRLDENVSAGIIMNKSIPKNNMENAGEISHINFQYGGPVCYCGRRGCVQTFCSTNSLVQTAIQGVISGRSDILSKICGKDLNKIDENTIEQAIQCGDEFMLKAVEDYVDHVLVLMDTLSQMFSPQIIVLDGKIKTFRNVITQLYSNMASSDRILKDVIIDFSHINGSAVTKGTCKAALMEALPNINFEDE